MSKKQIKILVHKTINSKIQQGNIITVNYGYARNYLLPRRIASIATKSIIQQLYGNEQIQKQKNADEYNKLYTIKHLIERIHKFTLKRRASSDYRFFGSIVSTNIIKTILHKTKILIDKKHLEIPQIRKTGVYTGIIQLFNKVTINIVIQILPINNI